MHKGLAILLTIMIVSLSGAMIPGPLTLITIEKTLTYGYLTGVLIVVGHAIVEIPLILLISIGVLHMMIMKDILPIIGVLGGILLAYLGVIIIKDVRAGKLIMKFKELAKAGKGGATSMSLKGILDVILAGILMTGFNPSFIAWWPTYGLFLITETILAFGFHGIIALILVHEAMDLFWYAFLSLAIFKGASINVKAVKYVLYACSLGLIVFGGLFFITNVNDFINVILKVL